MFRSAAGQSGGACGRTEGRAPAEAAFTAEILPATSNNVCRASTRYELYGRGLDRATSMPFISASCTRDRAQNRATRQLLLDRVTNSGRNSSTTTRFFYTQEVLLQISSTRVGGLYGATHGRRDASYPHWSTKFFPPQDGVSIRAGFRVGVGRGGGGKPCWHDGLKASAWHYTRSVIGP